MKRLLVALNAKYIHKAPGPWMLREACMAKGLDIDVMEADIAAPPDVLLRDILRTNAQVVGFSCYIWNITLVERLTVALRLASPGIRIFWGGPEVSHDAARRFTLLGKDGPDAIVCGEGEEVLPSLLLDMAIGRELKGAGIATLNGDGGLAPPVPPEKWPFLYPAGTMAEPHRLHYVETARGCPYSCRYCLSALDKGVRALPAGQALERLLQVRDAGAQTVKILDRTFNFDSARARQIWQGLIERGEGAIYHFEIVAQSLTDEDIKILQSAPAGLFQMEIGVQTLGDDALAQVARHQDFKRLAKRVMELREHDNIHLHLDLIAGLPGDCYEDIAHSVDRVLALRPHALQLGFLKLLPGSLIRKDFDENGWPYDPAPPYEVIATDRITAQELMLLHDMEEVLSFYVNSGATAHTARHFLQSFSQMEQVAKRLRAEGFFDRPRSQDAKFDALWRALRRDPLAEMLLRHDWLCLGKRQKRPWMRHMPRQERLREIPGYVMRLSWAEGYADDFMEPGSGREVVYYYGPEGVHRL